MNQRVVKWSFALFLGSITLWVWLSAGESLSLARWGDTVELLSQQVDRSPYLFSFYFVSVYIAVTALSLPFAVPLTLFAGAVFGLPWGVLLVSFASTIGATLAFLFSRFLFREFFESKFRSRIQAVSSEVERNGGYYLFSLRLLPLIPFSLTNILMGLSQISIWRFYWISQLGMLPGTVLYVNAGFAVASLHEIGDIITPSILFSFAFLALFPFAIKVVFRKIEIYKVYRSYSRPKAYDRNVIVVGAGAGGLVSTYIAAAAKAKVTLVEAEKMGGDCLNTGCVPSKALIKAAKVANQIRQAENFGLGSSEPLISLPQLMKRIKEVIRSIEPHDSRERYEGLGAEVLQGKATLLDPWRVRIEQEGGESRVLSARSIILATGATPIVPDLPGIHSVNFVTSDTLWAYLDKQSELPSRLLILGGGAIGCEMAQSFARLGVKVVLAETGSRLLKHLDEEASKEVEETLSFAGVKVLLNQQEMTFDHGPVSTYFSASCEEGVPFDLLLCAVGRKARIDEMGLTELGISASRFIQNNAYLQTRYPNIFVVGDAAGPIHLTHLAAHQAWYATMNALFGSVKNSKVDCRFIPSVVFTDPEVASVGRVVNQDDDTDEVEIVRYDLKDFDRAIIEGAANGFIKVVVAKSSGKILGCTIVSEHAGELIAEFVEATRQGRKITSLISGIRSYPTWPEANKYTAGVWRRRHVPARILRWVEAYHRWRLG